MTSMFIDISACIKVLSDVGSNFIRAQSKRSFNHEVAIMQCLITEEQISSLIGSIFHTYQRVFSLGVWVCGEDFLTPSLPPGFP